MFAIARNTLREACQLRVVYVLVIASVVLVAIVAQLPKFTLSIYDDIKMSKDLAVATASLCGLLVALFASVQVITGEIENWTVVTVLSKPVRRWEFVVGKFAGLVVMLVLVFAVLAVGYTLVVWWGMWASIVDYQGVYPELKRNFWTVAWQAADEMGRALVLSLLQVAVLLGIAVACCVRVPMIVSAVAFFAVFVAGHFVGGVTALVEGGAGSVGRGAGTLLGVLIADLEALNASQEVGTGQVVSAAVMAWGALYAALYSAAAVTAGVLLFRKREMM